MCEKQYEEIVHDECEMAMKHVPQFVPQVYISHSRNICRRKSQQSTNQSLSWNNSHDSVKETVRLD